MSDLSFHGHCFILSLMFSTMPVCAAQSGLAGACVIKDQYIDCKDSTTANSLNVMLKAYIINLTS